MKKVILCIDTEGNREQITRILNLLNEENIKATFFVVGKSCEEYPDLYKRIAKCHQVESHTYSHTNLIRLSRDKQREDIKKGKHVVEKITKRRIKGFRAPFHLLNRNTIAVLNELNFKFDVSNLYTNYNMGEVIKIRPSFFAEGFSTRFFASFHWNLMKVLFALKDTLIIPVHPQYTGYDNKNTAYFRKFLRYVKTNNGIFLTFDNLLEKRQT